MRSADFIVLSITGLASAYKQSEIAYTTHTAILPAVSGSTEPVFHPYSVDDKRRLIFATMPKAKPVALRGVDYHSQCADEFIGLEAYEEVEMGAILHELGYTPCAEVPEVNTDLYTIEPTLNCAVDKQSWGSFKTILPVYTWDRLDCKITSNIDPSTEIVLSRMGSRLTKKGMLGETSRLSTEGFAHRIRCGENQARAKQIEECQSLLAVFIQIEDKFHEVSKAKQAIVKERSAETPKAETDADAKKGTDEKPEEEKSGMSTETIMLIAGGAVLAIVLIAVALKLMSGGNKPESANGGRGKHTKGRSRAKQDEAAHSEDEEHDEEAPIVQVKKHSKKKHAKA